MRRKLLLSLSLLGSLTVCSSAHATISSVFNQSGLGLTPIPCATITGTNTAVDGERWCGATGANTIATTDEPSFDGSPIDVSVYFPPAPASGPDGNFPVMGVFHGYGQQKLAPASPSDPLQQVQKWVTHGYAVFTITARGFGGSCGATNKATAPCTSHHSYIHLLSNKFEVRDAQYLLGILANDGVISPTKIGATGISYGGGMTAQLGALKDRTYNDAGNLVAWTSPVVGTPMSIAATSPWWGWSDLAQSLLPNGSQLDYAAANPYHGPGGDHPIGSQKQYWTAGLYATGFGAGQYCTASCDTGSDVTGFKGLTDTGGPYPATGTLADAVNELSANHGAYGIDDSEAPAPALIQNGWNDDLFPVDEAIKYYNKIRQDHPTTPVNLWALDFGHSPRSPGTPNTNAVLSLSLAQVAWMDYYVRGIGSPPEDANGGVNTIASGCSDGTSSATPTAGTIVHAKNWASLAQGELSLTDSAAKTIASTATPADPLEAGTTVCNTQASADTAGGQDYTLAAQSKDYTIAGATTVQATLNVTDANDQLVARLYDVDPSNSTERLVGRAVVRPVSTGSHQQIFQLHPQEWTVVTGHQLKLELLPSDSSTQNLGNGIINAYVRDSTGQHSMGVSGLTMRVPTLQAPGSGNANIATPADKVLPTGYTIARDFAKATATPDTTPVATPTPTATYAIPTATPTATPSYPIKKKKPKKLSVKVKPKRDSKKPFKFKLTGTLTRPSGVSKAAGCKGTVKITAKRGKKKVGSKSGKLSKACKYSIKVKLNKKAGKRGTVKFTVSFRGNSKLTTKTVHKSAKYGKKH